VEGPEPEGMESWETILRFLEKRRSVLQGVCISGGEPLLVSELQCFIKDIQKLGYKVKVDTNGTKPEALEELQPDYIAMDVKTSPNKYTLVGGGKGTGIAVLESARLLIRRSIPHEFRITVAPEIFDLSDAREWATYLKGTMQVVLSGVRLQHVLDPDYGRRVTPYPDSFLQEVKDQFQKAGIPCRIRGETSRESAQTLKDLF